MSSSFSGLDHTLTWVDFPVRQGRRSSSHEFEAAAETSTSYSMGGIAARPIAGSHPARVQLSDSLRVRVTFSRQASYKMSWLTDLSPTVQIDLLNHEQGHYHISALIARDFYLQYMALRTQTYASSREAIAAAQNLRRATLGKIQRVNRLYDEEVHPEQLANQSHGPKQQLWDSFFQKSFGEVRTLGSTLPASGKHWVPLLQVLRSNGRIVG